MPLPSPPSPAPPLRVPLPGLRRWSTFAALCGMLAMMAGAGFVSGTTPQLTPRDVHIEVPADSLFGSLPVNRSLTVSIHVRNHRSIAENHSSPSLKLRPPRPTWSRWKSIAPGITIPPPSTSVGCQAPWALPRKRPPFRCSSAADRGYTWKPSCAVPSSSPLRFRDTPIIAQPGRISPTTWPMVQGLPETNQPTWRCWTDS
jgi:hypothetical protein